MWGVDDEIRDELKEVLTLVDRLVVEPQVLVKTARALCTRVEDMIFVVEKILADFKSGAKDEESFWIKMGDLYVLIRCFAIRDSDGQYMGTMEVTQNIKPIQEISGEKRLLSEDEGRNKYPNP